MKDTMKDLLKSSAISIGIAMTIFCIAGIVFDVGRGGNFSLDHYRFTKMIVGCILIGLGFGLPSVVYSKECLPAPIKVVVHMGIGCVVYTIVAYAVGWLGGSATIGQGLMSALFKIGIAFLIWFLFRSYYRKEAKRMNERIQAIKQ